MGADNPGWVPPEAGAARALPAAVMLMDQARAWKHDADLGNRLTDRGFDLLGRDAVLVVIGLQNAGKRPHEYVCEDRGARRVRDDPAAGAASQIPADCNPEVYDEGSDPAWTPGPPSSALPDLSVLCRHPRCPRPGDDVARGWLWRTRGW